jgi:hypothetical protein
VTFSDRMTAFRERRRTVAAVDAFLGAARRDVPALAAVEDRVVVGFGAALAVAALTQDADTHAITVARAAEHLGSRRDVALVGRAAADHLGPLLTGEEAA